MPNQVNIYEPRFLAEVVRTAPPLHTFFLDSFFTNVVILDDDGKVKAVASTDLTDLSGLYGITADSVEAADDDAVILLTGEYFADALVLEEGVEAADLETAFRNIGIFLK